MSNRRNLAFPGSMPLSNFFHFFPILFSHLYLEKANVFITNTSSLHVYKWGITDGMSEKMSAQVDAER